MHSLEDLRYSVQRPGLNRDRGNKEHNNAGKRPDFAPSKIIFKSQYDRFGKIPNNKSKELSQASLSSDSQVSYIGPR